MRTALTIASKDLRVLTRHKAALFWVLGFPLALAVFFGSVFAGGGAQRALTVVVSDRETTPFTESLLLELKRSDALAVEEAPLDSARTLVRLGKATAHIVFQPGITRHRGFREGDLEIGIDPSRRTEAEFLRGIVMQALLKAVSRQTAGGDRPTVADQADQTRLDRMIAAWGQFVALMDSARTRDTTGSGSASAASAGPPIRVIPVTRDTAGQPQSSWEITFPSSVMWALIGVCATFAVSIVAERTRGTYLRLTLAPIRRAHILAGKGLACLGAGVIVTAALLGLGVGVFGIRVYSAAQLAAGVLAAAVCFVGLMMLIAALGREERTVDSAAWAILLVQSMLGGGMIPLIAMPSWMRTLSDFSAVKWGILAIEGAIWRGFTWAEMATPMLVLAGIGLVGFTVGAWALSRSQ